jgi:hypothetical protein
MRHPFGLQRSGARPAYPATAARIAVLAAFGALVMVMPAAATMYKWVDANGNTIYSDQPPPANVKSEVIKPPPPPSNPDAIKEMVNADTEMKLREKQKIENAKQAQKKLNDAARRQELCANALGQIQTLQRDDLYRYDANGERVYLNADARAMESEAQQRIVRENCTVGAK